MSATTNLITLPYSDVQAPDSEYRLAKVTKMNGRESEAYDCVIMRGKVTAAYARNDGNGGQTFVNYANSEEARLFEEYVEKWPMWDLNPEGEPNLVKRRDDSVADCLFQEWSDARWVKRNSKTKFLLRLTPYEGGTIAGMTHETPGALERAVKLVGHRKFTYWNGTGWVQA